MVHGVLSGRHADVPSPPPLLLLQLPALRDRACAGVWARPPPFYTPSIGLCVRVLCHALGGARAYLPATSLLHGLTGQLAVSYREGPW